MTTASLNLTTLDRAAAPRAAEAVTCAHCALPVPRGLIDASRTEQFCCAGCEAAYSVIRGGGLEDYYRIRQSTGAPSARALTTARNYEEFDDPTFERLYVREEGEGVRSVDLALEGVTCIACVWLVERLSRIAPGVLDARLDLRRATVRVRWDDRQTNLSSVARGLDSLGYPPHPAGAAAAADIRRDDTRRAMIRLAVAGACAGNVMLLALAQYAGLFDEIEPSILSLFRWTSMAIGMISLVWPGALFFRGAWAAIRARAPHIDIPIALGLGAGGVWSVLATIRGQGEIYFDSLSVLVFALLVGRFLQQRQQRWAADALELLFSLTPTSARRVDGTGDALTVRSVPVEALAGGDVVEVLAGESFPADGSVIGGVSQVDMSILTGESRPMAIGVGDAVCAGAVNLVSPVRTRVSAIGAQTRIGRLMRLVEEGASRRAPIVLLADRAAGWFLRALIVIALLTVAGWSLVSFSVAIERAVALLIVACPCALGMSTPLALTASLARAARRGLLIKGGDALQRLDRLGILYLDKTGTLTVGALSVVRWEGDPQARAWAAKVERASSHPVARALVADQDPNAGTAPDAPSSVLGAGVVGECEGRRIEVGSGRFVRERRASIPPDMLSAERRALADGLSPVLVAVDGVVSAVAALGDRVRPDALETVQRIRALGWEPRILSGDRREIVDAVARELGIDPAHAHGEVLPEQKLEIVRASAGTGPVVMVGDGVNDAAALAAADVGIAVHGGAEASLAAADISIARPGLAPICELLTGARGTMNAIRACLTVSIAYNALGMALAIAGWITPLTAAILMPASSLTVLSMAFGARAFRPERKDGAPCP